MVHAWDEKLSTTSITTAEYSQLTDINQEQFSVFNFPSKFQVDNYQVNLKSQI